MKLGDLIWKIVGDTKDINSKLSKLDEDASKMKKTFTGISTFLKGAFAVAAVAGITKLTTAMISAASDAEETRNKFDVVFKGLEGQADSAAENLSDNFGISQQAAMDLLGSTGDLLTGFGLTTDAALDLSEKTNILAADLASFTNAEGGAEAISRALTSAYTGERDSLKTYGIVISEAMVQTRMMEDAQNGLKFATEAEAKSFATLTIATEQSKNSIGDFERSQDSYANQMKIAKAATSDLMVEMGRNLIPVATKGISIFASLTNQLAEYVKQRNDLREAEDAAEDGNATAEQTLLLLKAQADEAGILKAQYEGLNEKANTAWEEATQRVKNYETALLRAQGLNEQGEKISAEAAAQAAIDAEALATQEAERLADIGRRNTAWATTEEGRRAAIESEIAYYETFKESDEKAQIVLASLREELEGMTEDTEGLETAQLKQTTDYTAEVEANNAAVAELAQQIRDARDITVDWADVGTTGLTSMMSGFEDVGEALFNSESAWDAFASAGLTALASVLSALGAQLAAEAAVSFFGLIPNIPSGIGAAAGSAAAYTAAGVVSAAADSFEDGGIIPGYSYTGDNVTAKVNSGEMVLNTDQQAKLFDMIGSGSSNSGTININNLISMGKESEMRAAAKSLYPYIAKERSRRGE